MAATGLPSSAGRTAGRRTPRDAIGLGTRAVRADAPAPADDSGRAADVGARAPVAEPAAASAPLPLSVVVCTKDRPRELADCLVSIAAQTRLPRELVVVDAGVPAADAAVREFVRRAADACRVLHVAAAPGLPRQRNLGAQLAAGEVILFLDDDTVLDPAYVAEVWSVYEADAGRRIGGVGGAIVPDPTPREPRLRRALRGAFLLTTYGRGRVKRSGHPELALSPATPIDVEFLSGCNMSFRREVLDELRFDERLAGYALGEDLHFSYRVSRRWRLVLHPAARLEHRESGPGRPPSAERIAMGIANHFRFFREQVARGRLDWLWYAWAAAGDTLLALRHPGEGRLRARLAAYAAVARAVLRVRREAQDGPRPARRAPSGRSAGDGPAPAASGRDAPMISVVVPARDEERCLASCLDSLLAQSYPAERMEVLVVDNRSRDRTPEIAAAYAARDARVRVISCDGPNQAAGMNAGVVAARGEVVVRVDAHGTVAPDYVARVVDVLARHPGVVAVGGPYLPTGDGLVERAAALARSSRIGVGGGWYADGAREERLVRTVGCPAYRREAVVAAGMFDPEMAHAEDDELHWRLLKRGGRILLSPELLQFNRPRATLRGLARQYWSYGRGRLRVLRKHPDFLLPRHLVPAAFVAIVLGLAIAAPFAAAARFALAVTLVPWGLALVVAGLGALSHGWREALLVPCGIAIIHVAYGLGALRGALGALVEPRAGTPALEVAR